MREYFLFAGHCYYPFGGIDDLKFRGHLNACKRWFARNANIISDSGSIDNWAQIVDSQTLKIVFCGSQETTYNPKIVHRVKWKKMSC